MPVKLDINSEEFRKWSRDLKKTGEGSGVPHVYVVRSDGETLYGQGGGISSANLKKLLAASLETSGRILNEKEVDLLYKAAEKFESLQESGDIAGSVKAINKISKLGMPGQIPSYAEAASKVNELVGTAATEATSTLEELSETVESGETAQQLEAILTSLQLGSDYGSLKILKPELAKFRKELSKNKEVKQLVKEAKVISSAASASSSSARKKAQQKLQSLIDATEIDAVKSSAEQVLEEVKKSLEADSKAK